MHNESMWSQHKIEVSYNEKFKNIAISFKMFDKMWRAIFCVVGRNISLTVRYIMKYFLKLEKKNSPIFKLQTKMEKIL